MEPKDVIITALHALWNERRFPDELRSPAALSAGVAPGPLDNDAFRASHARALIAFPETSITVDAAIAEGDRVAFKATFCATTRDGRRVEMTGMGFATVCGSAMVEADNLWDVAAVNDDAGLTAGAPRTAQEAVDHLLAGR